MKFHRLVHTALIAVAFAFGSALAANPIDEIASADGLQKITVKDLDLAYAKPGASLTGYNKVMLEPVDVSFRKDWNPDRPGSRFKLSQAERDNIRNGVAKIVHDEFARSLSDKGAYPLVKEPGPDVLRVKAKVLNLFANAPDTQAPGVRTFTVSAGEMTLLLELFDSETGDILARVIDRQESRNTGMLQVSNSVMNSAEAQQIASHWARVLRKSLDKAHGIGKK